MVGRWIGLGAALALAIAGAGRPALAGDTPLRVATLVPCVESAVTAIGSSAQLVASVRQAVNAPLTDGLGDLGSPHSPNLEVLRATNADIIVIDGIVHAMLRPRLQGLVGGVLELDTRSIDGTFAGLAQLAKRAGGSDALDAAIAEARAGIDRHRLADPVPALTLFLAPGTPMVVTSRTWLGDLIGRVGFKDVAAGLTGDERFPGFITISDEVLSTLRPRVILLVAHGSSKDSRDAFLRRMASGGAWSGVLESAGDRVVPLAPELFTSNPCLEMPRAAEWLVQNAGGTPLLGATP